MPEVTDLMRVAQYVKSDRDAPSDVYNAACRMLDGPPPKTSEELERRIAELLTAHRSNGLCPLDGPCGDCDCFDPQHAYEHRHAKAIATEIVGPEVERLRVERDALKAAMAGDRREEIERIQAERDAMPDDERIRREAADAPLLRIQLAHADGVRVERDALKAAIESVRQYAAELRTTTSPAGIAAVYADRLEELLPARAIKAAESHRDGRTPQTLGASEGQATTEAQEAAQ